MLSLGNKNSMKKYLQFFLFLFASLMLSACGFHLQGEMVLAPPLHRMYLQTPNPYGYLARNLKDALKLSKVHLVSSPNEAQTVLVILSDDTSQELLSVSGTNQTRQYNLHVTVTFEITTANGVVILPPQVFTETRAYTVQANQILGSSNEASLFYRQMRRALAYTIMNRIASREVTNMVNAAFSAQPNQTTS